MKILMVSILSPHFVNWTEQLKDSGHEVYWFDVFDSNTQVARLSFVHQITGWRYKWDFKGRYWIKKNFPSINRILNVFNERDFKKQLALKIEEIQPDVLHSFVMYLGTAPILDIMKKYPEIKWIYSSWGSDLYYYSKVEKERYFIEQTLPQIDYLFTDCKRDYHFVQEVGFNGRFLGVFPGGGGYDLQVWEEKMMPFEIRKTILVKGYQGLHGKCIQVLEALINLKSILIEYEIIVFGAAVEVVQFILKSELSQWSNFRFYEKLSHSEVMTLMGRSKIYIGNSTSDGMPNTLLESIVMGTFPIQSNPGGATAEIIEDGFNGLLIENPLNVEEMALKVKRCLTGEIDLKRGVQHNLEQIKPTLERNVIRNQVLEKYAFIEQEHSK